jgi:choline dehydrogenase-like flavoprotein
MSIAGFSSFHDARRIPDGTRFECAVCVIGAGAAGLTIARALAGSEASVLVLESGGLEPEAETEALNTLSVVGHPYAAEGSRLRYFGGSTNHWGGHCVPLPSSAFERRDWIAHSGWPFGLEVLEPYYARAHEVLEIGPYDYRPEPVARRLGLDLLPLESETVATVLSRYHRQRFGPRYGPELDEASNVSVLLYATVTEITLDHDRRTVRGVTVRTLAGNTLEVTASVFVLATGGIENARILLLNHDQIAGGLGNQNDLVGRFFMEHIWCESGMILPLDQDAARFRLYAEEIPFEGDYAVRCHLALPDAQTRALRIAGYRVELQIGRSYAWYPAVRSLDRLDLAVGRFELERITTRDILTILEDLGPVLSSLWDQSDAPLVYGFSNFVEQVPNPESRVRLAKARDALGQNRAELDWRPTRQDEDGIRLAQALIAREVGRSGLGRMLVTSSEPGDTILPDAGWGNHHMGTTRMHADPKQGVVDTDCRVHSIGNLFVAGSSVFPTSGYANPTLTIVALALRLADHLQTRFFDG